MSDTGNRFVELSPREVALIKDGLGELCTGDCTDFGYDYDEDIEPLYVKLGDEPL